MICIPIMAPTTEAALEKMDRAFQEAEVVELRLDRIGEADLGRLLRAKRGRVMVTNRRREEGGHFPGTEGERMARLLEAVYLGADYVDVELGTAPSLREVLAEAVALMPHPPRIIVSWHDFTGTPAPEMLQERLEACLAAKGDIVKIVTLARHGDDNLRLLNLIPQARRQGRDIIAFCMGDEGRISRVMAPLLGSHLTYAALADGEASAPGQLTAADMRRIQQLLKGDGPHG